MVGASLKDQGRFIILEMRYIHCSSLWSRYNEVMTKFPKIIMATLDSRESEIRLDL